MYDGPTLNDTLAAKGYTTAPSAHGRKAILQDGEQVFRGTAGDVWAWLGCHCQPRANGEWPGCDICNGVA